MNNNGVHPDILGQDHVFSKHLFEFFINHGIAAEFDDNGLSVEVPYKRKRLHKNLCLFNVTPQLSHLLYNIYRLRSWSFTMPSNRSRTYLASMIDLFSGESEASKDISSSNFSRIVNSLLAPIFSIRSLTATVVAAISRIASSVNVSSTPSVPIRAMYCLIRAPLGSVRIRIKSLSTRESNSTRMGKRP